MGPFYGVRFVRMQRLFLGPVKSAYRAAYHGSLGRPAAVILKDARKNKKATC